MEKCEHRPEHIKNNSHCSVTCIRCNTTMAYKTWEHSRHLVIENEKDYLIYEGNECTHPYSKVKLNRSYSASGKEYESILECECGIKMTNDEHSIFRQAFAGERSNFFCIKDSNKTDMLIALRKELEKAHEKLELTTKTTMGVIEYVPLRERNIEKSGVDRLSIKLQILEDEHYKVYESRERMKKKLIELGIDIEGYLLDTEKVEVDDDLSKEDVSFF